MTGEATVSETRDFLSQQVSRAGVPLLCLSVGRGLNAKYFPHLLVGFDVICSSPAPWPHPSPLWKNEVFLIFIRFSNDLARSQAQTEVEGKPAALGLCPWIKTKCSWLLEILEVLLWPLPDPSQLLPSRGGGWMV